MIGFTIIDLENEYFLDRFQIEGDAEFVFDLRAMENLGTLSCGATIEPTF